MMSARHLHHLCLALSGILTAAITLALTGAALHLTGPMTLGVLALTPTVPALFAAWWRYTVRRMDARRDRDQATGYAQAVQHMASATVTPIQRPAPPETQRNSL